MIFPAWQDLQLGVEDVEDALAQNGEELVEDAEDAEDADAAAALEALEALQALEAGLQGIETITAELKLPSGYD